MSGISSRERVNNAIARKPNDRAPYDFRAEPEVFAAIRNVYNLPDDEAVRVWALSDIRDVGFLSGEGGYGGYTGFGWRDRVLADGTQEDFWGVRRKHVVYDGGTYVDICYWPLRDKSAKEIFSYDWPDPRTIFDFSTLQAKACALQHGEAYWCMMEVESLFDRCWALRGMEAFMTDLLAEPELADFMLDNMAEFFFTRTRMLLDAAGSCLDGVGIYNDLGTQDSLMISPAVYREFIKPRQRRFIEMVKEYGVKVFYHSCGAVEPLYDDLIEIGVDIIDPLQPAAIRTPPAQLKVRYGDRVTLHGGLDTQKFMPAASPAAIGEQVRHLLQTLGDEGGYILSGSHLYQVDITPAQIAAVHQAL